MIYIKNTLIKNNKMKNILTYKNFIPKIHDTAFIAQNAIISGDTVIGENSSVWYGCVIRGDVCHVRIGDNTNIQDGTIIHVTRPNHIANKTKNDGAPTIIGSNVTIGHKAIIHACTIQDNSFVGMGSILMDLSIVEEYSMLAAGAVLTPGKIVKSGQLWVGNPAKFFRDLTQEEKDFIKVSADNYKELANEYKFNK